jgi:hypothetical protein
MASASVHSEKCHMGFPRGIRVSSVVNYAFPCKSKHVSLVRFCSLSQFSLYKCSPAVLFISILLRVLNSVDRFRAEHSAVMQSTWEVELEKE